MLVLHPSSLCDVCMEDYDLDNRDKSPCAIHCGHVLCRTCVVELINHHSACPLCRNRFGRHDVRKLFIDVAPPDGSNGTSSISDTRANSFLEQVASVSEDGSSLEDALGIITEAMNWFSEQPGPSRTNPIMTLYSALISLAQIKLREVAGNQASSADLETLRAVEQSLLSQLAEEREASQAVRNDLQSEFQTARNTIQALRLDNGQLKESLEAQKTLARTLRSEFDAYQQSTAVFLEASRMDNEQLKASLQKAEEEADNLRREAMILRTLRTDIDQLKATLEEETSVSDTLRSQYDTSKRRAAEILQNRQFTERDFLARIREMEVKHASIIKLAEAEIMFHRNEVSRLNKLLNLRRPTPFLGPPPLQKRPEASLGPFTGGAPPVHVMASNSSAIPSHPTEISSKHVDHHWRSINGAQVKGMSPAVHNRKTPWSSKNPFIGLGFLSRSTRTPDSQAQEPEAAFSNNRAPALPLTSKAHPAQVFVQNKTFPDVALSKPKQDTVDPAKRRSKSRKTAVDWE